MNKLDPQKVNRVFESIQSTYNNLPYILPVLLTQEQLEKGDAYIREVSEKLAKGPILRRETHNEYKERITNK